MPRTVGGNAVFKIRAVLKAKIGVHITQSVKASPPKIARLKMQVYHFKTAFPHLGYAVLFVACKYKNFIRLYRIFLIAYRVNSGACRYKCNFKAYMAVPYQGAAAALYDYLPHF